VPEVAEPAAADGAQVDARGRHLLCELGHLAGTIGNLDDELPGHRASGGRGRGWSG